MDRPLEEIEDRFFAYHAALGHSPATINHYQDSLKNLRRLLEATNRPADTSSLTTS